MGLLSDRGREADTLAQEALRLRPAERPAFLDSKCGDDDELRREVELLVSAASQGNAAPNRRTLKPDLDSAIPPGSQLAHYKIIAMLGAGGMGQVYLAQDLRLRRQVAVKVIAPKLALDEQALRRLEHEAQAASALNHPNILTVYEFGEADGRHYIASEYVQGITLKDKIAGGKLELTTALDISIQVASALAAAHERGIVHRDIKPDNVIVRPDGILKVLDFGIAKLGSLWGDSVETQGLALTSSISLPGMVLGTANYMSPKQARGQEVDGRSDIFSLGSLMYELFTGKEAFGGSTTSDVIAEILKSEPAAALDIAPELPEAVDRIITKAMRKERDNRYQSVRDLLIDLQDFRQEADFQNKLQAKSGTVRPRTSSAIRPARITAGVAVPPRTLARRMWWWAATLVLLGLVALGGYFYQHKSRTAIGSSAPHSLAVLPFRNLKPDPATDFLGFSLADEIITKLGYVNSLSVRPSSSMEKYRGENVDVQKAAAALKVSTLLTGNYIKDGDDLRITTQLIDVPADRILWRDSMDVKYDKLLTVQDRVAQEIIDGLELHLTPAEAANVHAEQPIGSLAYEYYLRGLDLYSLNQFAAAVGMLEKSTELAPNYAPAWAHLGRAYTTYGSLQLGGRLDYSKAQAAYEKAIALNPALVEPRIYMANLLTDTGRVEQAVPLLRSVVHDSPNNAEAHWELGYAYRFGGMLPESLAEAETARRLDPLVKINSSAINTYLYLGQYEKFLESLPTTDSAFILFYRGLGEYYLNKREEAARDFDAAFVRDPSSLPARIGKALELSIARQNAQAVRLLRDTEQQIQQRGVTDAEGMYKVAQGFAVLGDKASALRMLRQSIAAGFFCYPYFERDPLLSNLRNEPEFEELMAQARQRHEQFKATFF